MGGGRETNGGHGVWYLGAGSELNGASPLGGGH